MRQDKRWLSTAVVWRSDEIDGRNSSSVILGTNPLSNEGNQVKEKASNWRTKDLAGRDEGDEQKIKNLVDFYD